jgi:hypothetical protein
MTLALGADPGDHATWYRAASLFAEADDVAGYDRHRRALLDRFGATKDPHVAGRTARACLLLPGPPDVIRRAAGLAGLAADQGGKVWVFPSLLLASGLAEYRLERVAAAEQRLRTSLALRNEGWHLRTSDDLVLAMTLQKQGRRGEEIARLTLARTIFDRDVPKLDMADEIAWHDVLICMALRREAESLVFDAGFPAIRSRVRGRGERTHRAPIGGTAPSDNGPDRAASGPISRTR